MKRANTIALNNSLFINNSLERAIIMSIQHTEEEEQLISECIYLKYIKTLEEEVSTVLGIIEDTIDDRKDSFMFMNPKSQQEEPVPIIRAIKFLQYACRTAFAFEPPESFREGHEFYRRAYKHLQKATQLLGFYYCNESHATEKKYDDICHHIGMYDDFIDQYGDWMELKINEQLGVASIKRR